MSPGSYVLAFGIAAVASGINSVAGGGSLVSFPVLLTGFHMPSVSANMTNTAGLWPGSLTGALGFLNLIKKALNHLKALLLPTLVGATVGAWLLTVTSPKIFDVLVPVLILFAAALLVFQPQIKAWSGRKHTGVHPAFGFVMQFLVSVYGGYFGAGMGIMMLAAFSLYVEGDIHEYNAIKNWLGLLINFIATLVFVLAKGKVGQIDWSIAGPMVVGSLVGGYAAARVSQRVDGNKLRVVIAIYGFFAAGYFIYKIIRPG